MEKLVWVCFVKHKLDFLVWFYVLQVSPICVQVVLHIVICHYQYCICCVCFYERWGHITWIKIDILTGIGQLSALIIIYANGHANFIKSTRPYEEIFSLNLIQPQQMNLLFGHGYINRARHDLTYCHHYLILRACWMLIICWKTQSY